MEFEELHELIEPFVDEAQEVFTRLESAVLSMEREVADGDETLGMGRLADLQRDLHTVKGNAGMLGMDLISMVVHRLEEVVKRDVPVGSDELGGLLELVDHLRAALDEIGPEQFDTPALQPWTGWLDDLAADHAPTGDDPEEQSVALPSSGLADDPPGAASGGGDRRTESIRVRSVRLDDLQREVGELILAQNALTTLLEQDGLDRLPRQTQREITDALDRATTRIRAVQNRTTEIRLMPLASILRRVPRIVRDAAAKAEKKVHAHIEGEEAQADKSVVDQLNDVIVHLVRNAVDHGIEAPEVREALGKSEDGMVLVRVTSRGDNITIDVEDDGAGIDIDRVRSKAVTAGLVSAEEADAADDDAALRWILRKGFSTRDESTELSGRGVGMDVVDATVRSLGGTVRIDSERGAGTSMQLTVPITTAVTDLLHIEVGGQQLGIPLRRILQTGRLDPDRIEEPGGVLRYRWRDDLIPYVDLRHYYEETAGENGYVVILEPASGPLCLPVARLRGKGQAVLHALEDPLLQEGPFSGATVRGDGYVSLVLDPDRLAVLSQGFFA